MLIGIEGRGAEKIMARLTGITAVLAVHSTNGRWDLIAEPGTRTLQEPDDTDQRIRNTFAVMTSENQPAVVHPQGGAAVSQKGENRSVIAARSPLERPGFRPMFAEQTRGA